MTSKTNFMCALRLTAFAAAIAAFGGPSLAQSADQEVKTPPSLSTLLSMRPQGADEREVKLADERNLRGRAMREAAQSYGARSGLLYRTAAIRSSLDKMATYLDATYNFTPLMLTDWQSDELSDGRARFVVPPVITTMGRTLNQENGILIRQRDKVLRIKDNARFSTAQPNWRNYLVRDLGESIAALPHVSLLPRTSDEQSSWNQWVSEGFAAGIEQADAIFEIDQASLSRDFDGMILYYELVDQKIVSLPFVATRNDGITGDGNQLNINDVTLRITVLPAFQTNAKAWVPTATK